MMDMQPETITKVRDRLNMSRQELADTLGMTERAVRQFERGERRPSKTTARLLLFLISFPREQWPL